ncbi:hypothetical protein MNBD_GAMMA12-230 [hydrothermal vent metagenome]|uniref:Uncharacterized protein n=1 Tax=hydrothermal vent metagenome TaxID=652676 RepID=A0A3B0YGU5_9ZZZZ
MSSILYINANSSDGEDGALGGHGNKGAVGAEGSPSSSKEGCCSSKGKCTEARAGHLASNGSVGGDGADGTPGSDATLLTLRAIHYSQNLEIKVSICGGKGGAGGQGGQGGQGGTGGQGGKTSGKACEDATLANGGQGGDGANGGTGAAGANGGHGGIVNIIYQKGNAQPIRVNPNVLAGAGGTGGPSGLAGLAGEGGAGGENEKGDKSGDTGPAGSAGLNGGGGSGGAFGSNGQQSITPDEVSTYQALLSQYSVPTDKQYADLGSVTSLNAAATSGITPYITTAKNMDTMRTMLGSTQTTVKHLPSINNMEKLSTNSSKLLNETDHSNLLQAAAAYIMGDTAKALSVKPLLDQTIATTKIAIFAIKTLTIPASGLEITTTDKGPKVVLLIVENFTFGSAATINVSPLVTLTINADNFTGTDNEN